MPDAANSNVQNSFDYTKLDAETFEFLEQRTIKLFGLLKRTTSDIIQIGNILIEIKQKLPHGQFLPWLEATLPLHRQTASTFMNTAKLANMYGWTEMSEILTFFDPSALGEIAKPSTSKQAREKAIAIAQQREFVSSTLAKQLKQEHPKTVEKTSQQQEPNLKQLAPSLSPSLASSSPASAVSAASEVVLLPSKRSKPEILAVIPRTVPPATVNLPSTSQPKMLGSASLQAETMWQLDGKHLLFCGEPDSINFQSKAPTQVSLLFAFPAALDWYPSVLAATKIIMSEQQLQRVLEKKGSQDIYGAFESIMLDCSDTGSPVVINFLPLSVSSLILNLTNCLLRRAIITEPDRKRCQAALAFWKKEGGKVVELALED